jgi:hypothetical protein
VTKVLSLDSGGFPLAISMGLGSTFVEFSDVDAILVGNRALPIVDVREVEKVPLCVSRVV